MQSSLPDNMHVKVLVFLCMVCHQSRGNFYVPGLPTKRYEVLGDINLGAIFPIYGYDRTKPCGDSLRSPLILQFVEALVYEIERINADDSILPQVKLGYVILDDCLKQTTTLAQCLSFLPQNDVCSCSPSAAVSGLTATPTFDVVGMIGSMKSSNSISAALLLGPAQLPQVSYASSSDELSDKTLYPYFLRVVPPDLFQIEGIVNLIKTFGWTYISVVYSEGSYGELGFKNLKRMTDEVGICIGSSYKIAAGSTPLEYDKIAVDLRNYARVVVVFSGPSQAKGVFAAVKRAKDYNKYIWIGGDAWAKRIRNLGEFWETALGAFTFSFYSEENANFTTWFKQKHPTTEKNPWFQEFWEAHFSCSFVPGSSNPCDANATLSESNGFGPISTLTPVMDAVRTFALGLHNLLNESCPGKIGTAARDCVTGPLLLQHMKNLSFTGNNGLVSFDANGNILGRYLVEQLDRDGTSYKQVKIAVYDTITRHMNIVDDSVTWKHVNREDTNPFPESVCSHPCTVGEYLIQKELPCCWECKKCRENEMIVANGTNCAPCEEYWWPDPATDFRSCSSIDATYIVWGEPLSIMLLFFSGLGIIASILVFAFYVRQNNTKCIKASGREMAYMMLVGIVLGYLTVVGLLTPPTDSSCKVAYLCFCISFSWIYSPLLTRTNRIYRIFESSKHSTKRPTLISPNSQVFIASGLILVQMILSVIVTVVYNPTSQLTMPVRTEKYVELSCDFTVEGLASFLAYNLVLVAVCSCFAFKTRKLPENFNESRFISMCVYTTLVLWLAFIPSYFTAGRQYLKTVMLSIVLILNETVAICFLYLPKIYASIYIEKESSTNNGTRFSHSTCTTNIAPATNSNPGSVNFLQVQPTLVTNA